MKWKIKHNLIFIYEMAFMTDFMHTYLWIGKSVLRSASQTKCYFDCTKIVLLIFSLFLYTIFVTLQRIITLCNCINFCFEKFTFPSNSFCCSFFFFFVYSMVYDAFKEKLLIESLLLEIEVFSRNFLLNHLSLTIK